MATSPPASSQPPPHHVIQGEPNILVPFIDIGLCLLSLQAPTQCANLKSKRLFPSSVVVDK